MAKEKRNRRIFGPSPLFGDGADAERASCGVRRLLHAGELRTTLISAVWWWLMVTMKQHLNNAEVCEQHLKVCEQHLNNAESVRTTPEQC